MEGAEVVACSGSVEVAVVVAGPAAGAPGAEAGQRGRRGCPTLERRDAEGGRRWGGGEEEGP